MTIDEIREMARILAQREKPLLGERESVLANIEAIYAIVSEAVQAFEEETANAGLGYLRLELTDVQPDLKDIRCFQFYLTRGRNVAIFVAMTADRYRMVGPFRRPGEEGPCQEGLISDKNLNKRLINMVADLIDEGFRTRSPKKKPKEEAES